MSKINKNSNDSIILKGVRVHNLKNINISIPRDKLIVVTGVSGSGKSSFAFDTLYAEGQRRYVESLSAYARQFLGRLTKPDVDFIYGIPPAIAIEQRVNTKNPRSTVGTSTEIYDYLKLLFARIGKTYSPVSGQCVTKDSVTDVVDFLLSKYKNERIIILSPIELKNNHENILQGLHNQGYTRIDVDGEIISIQDALKIKKQIDNINLLIDRTTVQDDDESINRLADSVQLAMKEGDGACILKIYSGNEIITKEFSNRFEADGIIFEEPSEHFFSFNNPVGACSKCEGYGQVIGIDEDLVMPNKELTIYEDAVACWKGEQMQYWKEKVILNSKISNIPIHKPFYQLTAKQKELIWNGNSYFKGINAFFRYLEERKYKIQYRVLLSRYRGKTVCPECGGARLKKETSYVKVHGMTIQELVMMPVHQLDKCFKELTLDKYENKIAERILVEICSRLDFLVNVGLGYLALNRLSSTLSGGESQRINLATALGSNLVGSLYILDEPSIGLHPRDTGLLIKMLRRLKDNGNTVVVVEHDKDIISNADIIMDMGPYAGRLGGEVMFQGTYKQLLVDEKGLTSKFINGSIKIPVPVRRRKWNNFIEVKDAYENNLKHIDVKFPLNVITVVTGVSGSGKSTLVEDVFFKALNRIFNPSGEKSGKHGAVKGDIERITGIEFVGQSPLGRSSRSNPVTYINAYEEIRKLYSTQPAAKARHYKPSHFSFNIEGGRCEECQGDGIIKVEMQFMADVSLVCDTCKGQRFKEEVLEVSYQKKNIYDVLEMTVDDALEFFAIKTGTTEKKIIERIKPLSDVGLGYVKLGQQLSTMSGGEIQRVKLASFLNEHSGNMPKMYVFDEPTVGLHMYDIKKLMESLNALVSEGHSIVIIEHNTEVMKCADWIIDLGPEGGEGGGDIIFQGVPEDIAFCEQSYTGKYLKEVL